MPMPFLSFPSSLNIRPCNHTPILSTHRTFSNQDISPNLHQAMKGLKVNKSGKIHTRSVDFSSSMTSRFILFSHITTTAQGDQNTSIVPAPPIYRRITLSTHYLERLATIDFRTASTWLRVQLRRAAPNQRPRRSIIRPAEAFFFVVNSRYDRWLKARASSTPLHQASISWHEPENFLTESDISGGRNELSP